MSPVLLIAIVFICVAVLVLIAMKLGLIGGFGAKQSMRSDVHGSVRAMVQAQRTSTMSSRTPGGQRTSIIQTAAKDGQAAKVANSQISLKKKLRFGQWPLPISAFYAAEVVISALVFALSSLVFDNPFLLAASLLSGPLFMNWRVNTRMYKRFQAFDKDYPPFLLSLIGLLKTGMNVITALQASAEGLEGDSLVRQEIELMLERLKLGVPEDQSIGSFAEDIFHEEIELFVQALLLSRRVGGNLSDTLDRLAKQVRKRQYFRDSARAAIGQQRMSIIVIIVILFAILGYMAVLAPELVFGAWKDPVGKQIVEGCLLLILLGIYWIRQVTKIKV